MWIKRFADQGDILKYLAILPFAFFSIATWADTDCPQAEAHGADGIPITFQQHRFADGNSDLVLIPSNGDVKRVTYGGGNMEGCHYKALAIIPGVSEAGQWGWHLAWAGNQGVFYARMDGEAWVSSPSKRLSRTSAGEVSIEANGSELLLRWREQHGDSEVAYQAVSQDEGRTWEQPKQVSPAN